MPSSSSMPSFSSSPKKNCDGFTAEEVQSAFLPSGTAALDSWTPTLDYEEADLGSLEPGPQYLTLIGRIVNFYDMARPSKSHKAAQGCLKIMLADDTGVLTVRLWYAKRQYRVRLGQLVTLWTVHISNSSDHNSLAPSSAPLFTSIFPEGERNCHFMVHETSDDGTQFKRPFGVKNLKALPDLMSLKSFTEGGYDVADAKLLVCVKTIGAQKSYMNRNGTTSELLPLTVFDDTAEAILTLYGGLIPSASFFQPSKTILLLSKPGWRIDRIAKLSLNGTSRIDVDPAISDARRLRALAQRLTTKEHVNPPFPDVDVAAFQDAVIKPLFTFAEVDEFARRNPEEKVMGYLSVLITQMNIITPFKRNMLLCNECCGTPIFANAVVVTCKQCGKNVTLRLNPRIVGPLIDETGQLSSGKLILSDQAWTQLLGRTPAQLLTTPLESMQYLEHRLLFLRVTMGFALVLEDEIGRLGVWSVE